MIFNHDKTEKYAIEIKFPTNGQYPEQMFIFCKDIKFLEELKNNDFPIMPLYVLQMMTIFR